MTKKIAVVLGLAILVAGLHLASQVVEVGQVQSALSEVVALGNSHTFADREGLEAELRRITESRTGRDAGVLVELYHYRGIAYREDVGGRAVPSIGGIEVVGEQIRMSVLAVRVSWFQEFFGKWEREVTVVKSLIVRPELLGRGYGPPPPGTFEFTDSPWLLLDPAR